jgi:hypothetical protein
MNMASINPQHRQPKNHEKGNQGRKYLRPKYFAISKLQSMNNWKVPN